MKKRVSVALGMLLITNTVAGSFAAPASAASTDLPPAPAWGYFVDNYKNNTSVNMTVYSNPAIGTLSKYLDLWTPGTSWNNGTKLNAAVLDANIQYVADLAATRTPAQGDAAYYDDRRNQTYSVIDGLGSLADVYRSTTNTFTSIKSIPEDATTVKYDDLNGANKGGDSSSELGKMVDLIGTLRGNYASTTPSKNFYNYMRPYRWADNTSMIVPTLRPAISPTPATDGGFPSGHTNASYLAALALAYSVPERFQELLTRASEIGNNRIVAGMHSPLDVMGGRVLATALAAAALADPDNAAIKQEAYAQAHEILLAKTGTAEDRFTDYRKNKAQYSERLTYGFKPIGSVTEPVAVPKRAEVLLETRLPYLSDEQRREVLATTGLPSGYPVLDDPEGWGRLDLFAAADGYGAFERAVTVTMDADKGGFYAMDQWRNNISGSGKLTKDGSGTLKLMGGNTYTGGTELSAGTLEGDSETAFGKGDVAVNGGTLAERVNGKMTIGGDLTLTASGTLELGMASASDVLDVKGAVAANGKLRVKFDAGYVPGAGSVALINHSENQRTGQFSSVEIEGLPSKYSTRVVYESNRIALAITDTTGTGTYTPPSSGTVPHDTNNGGSTGGNAELPPVKASPFVSNVVNQESLLKVIGEAAAATKNENKTFSDTSGHWATDDIAIAVRLLIVDGYKDNTFRPNAPVTRAEISAMIVRALGLTPNPSSSVFKDTGSNWAAGYIGSLAEKGVVTGYKDGSFKPDAAITRAELVAIIGRVLNLSALATDARADFTDVSDDYWAASTIEQAYSAKLVKGTSSSTFAPNGKTTRAEAVTLIVRALESDSAVKAIIEGM
ncbi:S-layer homology domain-containing protein [Cohnella lupini]|nr:S-layer homology domain-containing protein [Cohnella lupini]